MNYRKLFGAKALASTVIYSAAPATANDYSMGRENSADQGVVLTRTSTASTACPTGSGPKFVFHDMWQGIYGDQNFWYELGQTTCDTNFPGVQRIVYAWVRPGTGYYEDVSPASLPAIGTSSTWKIVFAEVMPSGSHRWQGYVGGSQIFDQAIPASYGGKLSRHLDNSADVGLEVQPNATGASVPITVDKDLKAVDINGSTASWSGSDFCKVIGASRGMHGNWFGGTAWYYSVGPNGSSSC